MNLITFTFRKLSPLFLAGLIGVLLLANFAPSQAQPSSDASSAEYNITNNLEAFNLDESEPILPEELEQSESPLENGRLIFGEDNRVPMTTTKYPWSAIGRIQGISASGESYICTGALIGVDVAITNAHCVIDPATHQWSSQVSFAPNLINGRLQSANDLAQVVEAKAGTDFQETNGGFSPDDWAILKLNKPLGLKYGTLNWQALPTSTLSEHSDQFAMVGYSGDFPPEEPGETASAHLGCSIKGEASQMLLHDCDMFSGSSGGPILGKINNEFRIVGINFGSINSPDTGIAANLAVKVSRIR
jgi:protease YdgD